jgi:hypothetical protein
MTRAGAEIRHPGNFAKILNSGRGWAQDGRWDLPKMRHKSQTKDCNRSNFLQYFK